MLGTPSQRRVHASGNLEGHIGGHPEPIAPVAVGTEWTPGVVLAPVVHGDDAGIGHERMGSRVPDPDPRPWKDDQMVLGRAGIPEVGIIGGTAKLTDPDRGRSEERTIEQHTGRIDVGRGISNADD